MRTFRSSLVATIATALMLVNFAQPAKAAMAGVPDAVLLTDANSNSPTSVTLTWDTTTLVDNGTPISGFAVIGRTGTNPFLLMSDLALANNPSASTYTLNDLLPGTAYDFEVAALSAAGDYSSLANFNFSLPVTIQTQLAPAAPTITVLATSTTTLDIAWSGAVQANGETILDYVLKFRQSGAANFTTTTVNDTVHNYGFTGLTADTEYEIQIFAESASGPGLTSNSLLLRTDMIFAQPADPVVVTSVDATAASDLASIRLNFSAPANGGAAITGYELQFKSLSDSVWTSSGLTIAADATTVSFVLTAANAAAASLANYIDSQLQLNPNFSMAQADQDTYLATQVAAFNVTNFQFQIAALNSVAPTDALANFSNPIAFSVPAGLTINTATASVTSVSLSWSVPTVVMNSANIGYAVRYRVVGAANWSNLPGPINATSVSVTGLTSDLDYEFQLAAINGVGVGEFGASKTAHTLTLTAATVPDPVAISTATPAGTSVALVWTKPVAHGAAITAYAIQYRPTSSSTWVQVAQTVATLSTTVTGLTGDTEYEFQVAAINSVGQSAFGASKVARTLVVVVPKAPDAVVIDSSTVTTTSVTLNWTPPNNNNSALRGYAVRFRLVGATNWVASSNPLASAKTVTVTGLTPGASYEFQVIAFNGVATTIDPANPLMTPLALTTLGPPSAPAIVSSTSSLSSISIVWSASDKDGGSAITGYQVGYRVSGTSTYTVVSVGNVLTFEVTGLQSNTSYDVVVAAINANGVGANSAVATVRTATPPPPPPTPPAALTVLFTIDSAVLSKAALAAIKSWAGKVDSSMSVSVDGFADGITTKKAKADKSAVAIAKARATAVAKALKALGISAKITGRGASAPVSKTDPNKNRRAVLFAR